MFYPICLIIFLGFHVRIDHFAEPLLEGRPTAELEIICSQLSEGYSALKMRKYMYPLLVNLVLCSMESRFQPKSVFMTSTITPMLSISLRYVKHQFTVDPRHFIQEYMVFCSDQGLSASQYAQSVLDFSKLDLEKSSSKVRPFILEKDDLRTNFSRGRFRKIHH